MKKQTIIIVALAGLTIGFLSGYYLRPKPQQELTGSNGLKEINFEKIFGISHGKNSSKDQRICKNFADSCVTMFKKIYTNSSFGARDLAVLKTTSVNFGSRNLYSWLYDITKNTDADSIKIKFGIYTPQIIAAFPGNLKPDKKGRLTVFLYATKFDVTVGNTVVAKYTSPSTFQQTEPDGCVQAASANPGAEAQPFNLAGIEP